MACNSRHHRSVCNGCEERRCLGAGERASGSSHFCGCCDVCRKALYSCREDFGTHCVHCEHCGEDDACAHEHRVVVNVLQAPEDRKTCVFCGATPEGDARKVLTCKRHVRCAGCRPQTRTTTCKGHCMVKCPLCVGTYGWKNGRMYQKCHTCLRRVLQKYGGPPLSDCGAPHAEQPHLFTIKFCRKDGADAKPSRCRGKRRHRPALSGEPSPKKRRVERASETND